jgi:hypothetical protein
VDARFAKDADWAAQDVLANEGAQRFQGHPACQG